jgi:broad specificity phosphatase PhoE
MGIQQAEDVAATISAAPNLFVVSPYLRARQTAEPSLKKFSEVPVEVWPVQEFKFLGDQHFDKPTNKDMRAPISEAFWTNPAPDTREGPGAETFNELMKRVHSCLERLRSLDAEGMENVVIFSHGQFMMALRLWLKDPSRKIDSSFMQDFWQDKKTNLIPNGCGFILVSIKGPGRGK